MAKPNTNRTIIEHYNDFEIILDDDHRFGVIVPARDEDGLGETKIFDTMAEAKKYVDGVIQRRNTVKKKALSLPGFYQPRPVGYGRDKDPPPPATVTIKGYHAGHGGVLPNEKNTGISGSYGSPKVYVEHPYVRRLYAEVEAIAERIGKLRAELHSYEFKDDHKATRDPAAYEAAIDRLKAWHAECLKAADAAHYPAWHETDHAAKAREAILAAHPDEVKP